MKINKWFGKLNIRFEIRWKRRYHHSTEWVLRRLFKDSMIYGTGIVKADWIKPWQFWKKGWYWGIK